MPRVGVLMGFAENDPEGKLWFFSFAQAFQELGWIDGRNVRIDVRWDVSNSDPNQKLAKELVSLKPDVILVHGTPLTASLQRETHTIPIVFGAVSDPVGEGFVESLSRSGKNITGFVFTEGEMGGKWLELLKEISPSITRAAAMFDPDTAPGRGMYYLPSFETAARSLKVEPIIVVHNDAEIETAVTSLGREPGGGLVVIADVFWLAHRTSVISAAARTKIPAIYFHAAFAREGGLFSYGPDNANLFRRAATYVDRILRGADPAGLPVQVPIKFVRVVNLKTAKALGISIPQTLQVAADEVIE
jgi:putative tryptophan/tyrosine transport system substrate-binding protein